MPAMRDVVEHLRYRITGHPPSGHDGPLPYVPHRPTTNPILPVGDMRSAIDCYRSLGFDVHAYDEGYAWVRHCGWEFLHLRLVADLDPAVNAASAYIHVDDADRWHAAFGAAAAAGVTIGDLVDQPWGLREFELTDPAGNLLRIGSPPTGH